MIEERELVTSDLVAKLLASGFSRVPVFRRDRAHVIGFILVRDILTLGGHASPVDSLRLRRLPHVASDTGCFELLQRFKQGQSHMALVVASDLVTPLGVVTLFNILELLLGSIADEFDHDEASGVGPPRMLARSVSRRLGPPLEHRQHVNDAAIVDARLDVAGQLASGESARAAARDDRDAAARDPEQRQRQHQRRRAVAAAAASRTRTCRQRWRRRRWATVATVCTRATATMSASGSSRVKTATAALDARAA
jgi:hypothetical protein